MTGKQWGVQWAFPVNRNNKHRGLPGGQGITRGAGGITRPSPSCAVPVGPPALQRGATAHDGQPQYEESSSTVRGVGGLRGATDYGTQYPWHNRRTGLDGRSPRGHSAGSADASPCCPSSVATRHHERIPPITLSCVRSRGVRRCGALPRPPRRQRWPWWRAGHGPPGTAVVPMPSLLLGSAHA